MVRNIKAVERTAFPQQAKTVKASPTAGTLCEIAPKLVGKLLDKNILTKQKFNIRLYMQIF
jgi:hypothetical protein